MRKNKKTGSFLSKLFLTSVMAGGTFALGSGINSYTQKEFQAPPDLKTQFVMNASDISVYASSDAQACLNHAVQDYFDPLRGEIFQTVDYLRALLETDVALLKNELQTQIEREKLVAYAKEQGFDVPFENVYSNEIENLANARIKIKETRMEQAIALRDFAQDTALRVENVFTHLVEEGLIEQITPDTSQQALLFLMTLQKAGLQGDNYLARSIFLASALPDSIQGFLDSHMLMSMRKVYFNPEAQALLAEWKETSTQKNKEEVPWNIAQEFTELVADAVFAGSFFPKPRVIAGYIDPSAIAAYNKDSNTILLNAAPNSNLQGSAKELVSTAFHEVLHAYMYNVSTIAQKGQLNPLTEFSAVDGRLSLSQDIEDAAKTIFLSLETYVPAHQGLTAYYMNINERLAFRYGDFASLYFEDPTLAESTSEARALSFLHGHKKRERYQNSLQNKKEISCNGFGQGALGMTTFVDRKKNRATLAGENLTLHLH